MIEKSCEMFENLKLCHLLAVLLLVLQNAIDSTHAACTHESSISTGSKSGLSSFITAC